MGGGLAIHRGIQRQDDLAHPILGDAVNQSRNAQFLWPDLIQRR